MTRIAISPEIAADVLFKANRTCCVCREPHRKVEIHHLDGDPSHNEINNLIVLCKDCHSDAHTTHAFSRNLSQPLLRKYNESWREIVRLRVTPGGLAGAQLEYRLEILLELYLIPHRWKGVYINLYPGQYQGTEARTTDGWNYLIANLVHMYSPESWKHYRNLFDAEINATVLRLESLLAAYGDAIGPDVKVQVFRTASALRIERLGYLGLPALIDEFPESQDAFFQRRFTDTLSSLMTLSQLADKQRGELQPIRYQGTQIADGINE